jgi:hypothetical protein
MSLYQIFVPGRGILADANLKNLAIWQTSQVGHPFLALGAQLMVRKRETLSCRGFLL